MSWNSADEAWRGNVALADNAAILIDIYSRHENPKAQGYLPALRREYLTAVRRASEAHEKIKALGGRFVEGDWND